MARLNLEAAVLEAASATKVEFGHDRTHTVGASEISVHICARKVAMKKQGLKPDPDYVDDPGFAWRGNVIEDNVFKPVITTIAKRHKGAVLWAGQAEQQTFEWKSKFASCTPDGLLTGMPFDFLAPYGVKKCTPEVLVEAKSVGPFIPRANLPKPAHPDQVHFGIGLVRRATEYKPDFGLLLYFNADKYTEATPIVIQYADDHFKKQLARAKRIITTPWNKLAQEGKIGGGKQCGYCEFSAQCLGKRKAAREASKMPAKQLITF